MRNQNNYKTYTVIFTLLMLGQEISVHAGERKSFMAEADIVPNAKQIEDNKSDVKKIPQVENTPEVKNKSDVEVKPLDSQAGNVEKPAEKSTEIPADKPKEIAVNYFDILEFRVDGNTKLAKNKIEAAIYPHMGEKKTIDDVEKARDALEKSYHQAGYLTVLVDIP